jgi:hypothetical protein
MSRVRDILILLAGFILASCQRSIDAHPVRIVDPAELSPLLPPHFEESEGLAGKLIGVLIEIDGDDLEQLAGGSRNPIVRYVRCADGGDAGSSFGPFIGRDFVQSYVRENKLRGDRTYTLVATGLPDLLERKSVCVQLEARWYSGIVAKSSRLPLPAQR